MSEEKSLINLLIQYLTKNGPSTLGSMWRSIDKEKRENIKCKKLLMKYPNLFQVDGDCVMLVSDELNQHSFVDEAVRVLREVGTGRMDAVWGKMKFRPDRRCKKWFLEHEDVFVVSDDLYVQLVGDVEEVSVLPVQAACQMEVSLVPEKVEILDGVQVYDISVDNIDIQPVLDILPDSIMEEIGDCSDIVFECVSDMIIDIGRPLVILGKDKSRIILYNRIVTEEDLYHIQECVSPSFIGNRCAIGDTLHRCSLIVEPDNSLSGMTIRISRGITGLAETIADILLSGESLLLIGKPGVGKTTLLRDIARLHSTTNEKQVIIVDTTCEIAGDGKIPHKSVGMARRMKVKERKDQHKVQY
eukprot:TRINITY_DN5163_c0_g2_i1.p1 TRINITY_DN5163_c0_g2~~TRINITY_DN5163_c0_g2_i1.p1  ORF type:complete len:383 (+),score=84.12 TRINITY_DN5163_c0_g2_i1:78-1151(+)